jgi:hypothetical protein
MYCGSGGVGGGGRTLPWMNGHRTNEERRTRRSVGCMSQWCTSCLYTYVLGGLVTCSIDKSPTTIKYQNNEDSCQ